MARPLKQGLEYFNMDCDFEQDPKIERLDYKFGNNGIAIFMRILARVYSTGGKFNISESDIDLYAGKFKTNTDTLKQILEYMREINLFPAENFLSKSVRGRLKKIQYERARKRNHIKNKADKGGIMDGNNPAKTPLIPPKEKKRKEKESKDILQGFPELNNELFRAAFNEWIAFRKEIKKALKPSTITKQLEFLKKQPDPVVCINQSIQNGWQGLFEVKNGRTQSETGNNNGTNGLSPVLGKKYKTAELPDNGE